jgi:hypothetical protein
MDVEVPDLGTVEFPDDLDHSEIESAIHNHLNPVTPAQALQFSQSAMGVPMSILTNPAAGMASQMGQEQAQTERERPVLGEHKPSFLERLETVAPSIFGQPGERPPETPPSGLLPTVGQVLYGRQTEPGEKPEPGLMRFSPKDVIPEQSSYPAELARQLSGMVNIENLGIVKGLGSLEGASGKAADLLKAASRGYFAKQGAEMAGQAAGERFSGAPLTPQEKAQKDFEMLMGGTMAGLPTVEAVSKLREGAPNAIEKGKIEEGSQLQYPGAETQRVQAETGGGDSVKPEAPVQEKVATAKTEQPDWADKLPPSPLGVTRVFHGEGGVEGGGTGGAWFTTNPERAAGYGENVSYVDVPDAVVESAKVPGTKGDVDLSKFPEILRQSQPVEGAKAKVHEISEPATAPVDLGTVKTLTPAVKSADGRIMPGASHVEAGRKIIKDWEQPPGEQGFQTDTGEFISRAQGAEVFKRLEPNHKMINPNGLYSEDLAATGRLSHMDAARYDNLVTEMRDALKKGDFDTFTRIQREVEQIKNRQKKAGYAPPIQEIRPQISTIEGGKEVGKKGQVHNDIIAEKGLKAEDIDRREFVGPNGETLSREQLAQHPEIKTEVQPGKAHASDLAKAQEAAPTPEAPKPPETPPAAPEAPGQRLYTGIPGLDPVIQKVVAGAKGMFDAVRNTDFKAIGSAVKRAFSRVEFPKLAEISQKVADKAIEFVTARDAAPYIARSMVTDVLGDKANDPAFRKRFGAVLVEERLRAIQQGLIEASRKANDPAQRDALISQAADVRSLVGEDFKDEGDFRAALADPEIQAALQRHKQSVQPMAEEAHALAGGQLAGSGPNTGAFVNLKAVFGEGADEGEFLGTGRAQGNLTNPLKRSTRFGKRAAGTAEKYETDYRELGERMVRGNYEEGTLRKLYGALEEAGIAKRTEPGQPIPEFNGKRGRILAVDRRAGKFENLAVDPNHYSELARALKVEEGWKNEGASMIGKVLTGLQLKGIIDPATHSANLVAALVTAPGGKTFLSDFARRFPGVNLVDAITRISKEKMDLASDSPEIQRQLANLARLGALRFESKGFIGALDKSVRLSLDSLYSDLVKRGISPDTDVGRRDFVNRAGQYNPYLMGRFARMLKDTGISPFIVAGKNFNRLGLDAMLQRPGVATTGKGATAQLVAMNALRTGVAAVVIPSLINSMTVGSPMGRKGVPVGAIDLGSNDEKGNPRYFDPLQLMLVRRGMRITGVNQVVNDIKDGKLSGQTAHNALRDIISGQLHPYTGPFYNVAHTALFGTTGTGYQASKDPRSYTENAKAAALQLNPLLSSAAKGVRDEDLAKTPGEKVHSALAESGKQVARIVGLNTGNTPVGTSAGDSEDKVRGMVRDYTKKSLDPKIQHERDKRAAETFPTSDYAPMMSALKAGELDRARAEYSKLKEFHKPDQIFKRMKPFSVVERGGAYERHDHPFSGLTMKEERAFVKSLSPEDKKTFDAARKERVDLFKRFQDMKNVGKQREFLEKVGAE